MVDICIIGGGASGIIAAIAARMEDPDVSICIIEKKDKIGSKLLATGNGRCNFTNALCENSSKILDFFHVLGIKARVEEQGRIYPYSGRAKDVVNVFESYLNAHNIKVYTEFVAEGLNFHTSDSHAPGRIDISGNGKKLSAKKVLLATGGKAGPQFGCSGDGYKMAREAGHTVTKVIPALSPVECEGSFEKLKGVRARASVTLYKKGNAVNTETGELQFTEYGLSGICIFNLSRDIRLEDGKFTDYEISVDLLYDISIDELELELKFRMDNPDIPNGNLLVSLVPEGLADFVLNRAGFNAAPCLEHGLKHDKNGRKFSISDEQIKQLAYLLKNLEFTVSNVKGWKFAQCTSGGIPVSEINMDTMESKIVKDLYFAGKLIDYDGPCGGYNLHNAWETGLKAGKAMAMKMKSTANV